MQASRIKFISITHTVLISCASLSSYTLADVVELNNGDRISGEITELNNNTLKIKTTYADEVTLDIKAVRTFQTESPQQWQVNLKKNKNIVYESNRHGHVVIDGKTITINKLALLPENTDWKKSGLLEASVNVDNDQNRKKVLHVNTELNLESKYWRHKLKAETQRDKELDRVTEDTSELNYTLDYLIDSHWLMRTDSIYREEGVDVVNQYWYVGSGPGYRLWGEDKDKLDTIISYNRLWLIAGPVDWEFGAWAIALDYKQFFLDEKLELFSNMHIATPMLDAIDYIADSSSGLRYYFKHNIHVSFKYDYNETRFIAGTIKDNSYILSAGVNF